MKIFNSIDNNHFHKMQKAKDKEKKVQIQQKQNNNKYLVHNQIQKDKFNYLNN